MRPPEEMPAPVRREKPARYRAPARLTATDFGLPERLVCPFCGGSDTELHSPFGSALSVATYWCHACHTAFEWFKR